MSANIAMPAAPGATAPPAQTPPAPPAPPPPHRTIREVQQQVSGYQGIIDRMRAIKTPDAPELAKLPVLPPMHDAEVMGGLGNWGTLLAIFGSLATREPMVAALNAAANGMHAFQAGNMQAAAQHRQDFELNLKRAIELNREQQESYIAALQKANFNLSEAKGELSAQAAASRDHLMEASIGARSAQAAARLAMERLRFGLELHLLQTKMEAQAQTSRLKAAAVVAKLQAAGLPVPPSIMKESGLSPAPHGNGAPEADPLQKIAEGVAHYEFVPSSFALARPEWIHIMSLVRKINPQWSMVRYNAMNAAAKNFFAGPQGQQIQSFNAVINHLHVLNEAAKEIASGHVKAANRALQWFQTQFGMPGAPTYHAVASIVGQELVKAIVPGGGGESERLQAAANLMQTGSPAQRRRVIQAMLRLAAGQLGALRTRFRATTGMTDFDTLLSPAARAELHELDRAGAAPGAPAGALPGATHFVYDPGKDAMERVH
jgi:hypothetical protein